jgi:Tetracyclin repressor-like, C-terminal domain
MAGLLNAVARYGFALYLGEKAASAGGGAQPGDPVSDLRSGWDAHIEFALRNPAMYALMYGEPRPGMEAATGDIRAALTAVLQRIAVAGRLAVNLERATEIVLAANVGTALALLDARSRDRPLNDDFSDAMREMVLATITTAPAQPTTTGDVTAGSPLVQSAVALTAGLPLVQDRFSPGEFTLLHELLDRLT